jgi:hypothetical protein
LPPKDFLTSYGYRRVAFTHDPAEHRLPAASFGQDVVVAILSYRSMAWMLGYPMEALADSEQPIKHARKIGQAATLMFALLISSGITLHRSNGSTNWLPNIPATFGNGIRGTRPIRLHRRSDCGY